MSRLFDIWSTAIAVDQVKKYLPSEFSTRMPGQSQVTIFNGDRSEQFHDGLKKFVEEAKHLAKFQNEQGIVKIFDSFEENDTAYIIMEYLDGETLATYLKRKKTISEDDAVAMLMPVMESLQTVHEEGLLHRDIAPDNIFITKTRKIYSKRGEKICPVQKSKKCTYWLFWQ